MTPLMPPMTKLTSAPTAHSIAAVHRMWRAVHSVAVNTKNATAVGNETPSDATEKKLAVTSGSPVANMWCTHTPKLMNPVATVAATAQV